MSQTIEETSETKTEPSILDAGPGVYRDVPSEVYHAHSACSKSALDWIYDYSPMHLKYQREHPAEPTDALRFGSAVHLAILEPDKFKDAYVVSSQCQSVVKTTGRQCSCPGKICIGGNWFCGKHANEFDHDTDGKPWITQDQKEQIENIARAVSFHKSANWLLKEPGDNELSVLWDQPIYRAGADSVLPCKMRADGVRVGVESILDIKTTECASREEFERSIGNWGYHRQAAMYQDGLAAHDIKIKHFAFIVVEKKAPYGVACYRILDEAIQAGREEIRRLQEVYANCQWANQWPGYSPDFQDISIPRYTMNKIIKESI